MSEAAEKSPAASFLRGQEEANELIPGLPNCVVLDCVLPCIPWYARAILSTTSKAWNHALRQPRTYSKLSRRAQETKPCKGWVMVHQLSEQATLECYKNDMKVKRRMPRLHAISFLEEEDNERVATRREDAFQAIGTAGRMWTSRKLPPIPAFAPLRILQDCGIACIDGKIFVMGGWEPRTDAVHPDVYMLNIAAGLWEWEALPPMHFARAFFHCTSIANKIYVAGGNSSPCIEDSGPEVFDVDTQTWALLPRVGVSRSFHFNGLSLIKGSNLVLSHGFCTTERGELVSFQRAYDPTVGVWRDYECVDDVKDDYVGKCDDGRDIASKCNDARDFIAGKCAATCGVIMSVMMM